MGLHGILWESMGGKASCVGKRGHRGVVTLSPQDAQRMGTKADDSLRALAAAARVFHQAQQLGQRPTANGRLTQCGAGACRRRAERAHCTRPTQCRHCWFLHGRSCRAPTSPFRTRLPWRTDGTHGAKGWGQRMGPKDGAKGWGQRVGPRGRSVGLGARQTMPDCGDGTRPRSKIC
jgi:hypothetical protein